MTPGQALRAIERGKIVKDRVTGTKWRRSVQDGYAVEFITDWLITFSGDNCFPAAGDFVVLKPAWPKGEVRWQKGAHGVYRYTSRGKGEFFIYNGTQPASAAWDVRPSSVIDITPEEGLRLIHAMGWNEDGTKREPPKRDVGADPRVGDVVDQYEVDAVGQHSVTAVAYGATGPFVWRRDQWERGCKTATKISRVEEKP